LTRGEDSSSPRFHPNQSRSEVKEHPTTLVALRNITTGPGKSAEVGEIFEADDPGTARYLVNIKKARVATEADHKAAKDAKAKKQPATA
jgi:hypothetical protein